MTENEKVYGICKYCNYEYVLSNSDSALSENESEDLIRITLEKYHLNASKECALLEEREMDRLRKRSSRIKIILKENRKDKYYLRLKKTQYWIEYNEDKRSNKLYQIICDEFDLEPQNTGSFGEDWDNEGIDVWIEKNY